MRGRCLNYIIARALAFLHLDLEIEHGDTSYIQDQDFFVEVIDAGLALFTILGYKFSLSVV
jgi:hypothetical protein